MGGKGVGHLIKPKIQSSHKKIFYFILEKLSSRRRVISESCPPPKPRGGKTRLVVWGRQDPCLLTRYVASPCWLVCVW